ncbi:DegT/DnrJ/EryC1/StrS family aminotransferase [Adhaeribacter terreus]|uniref:DegT/DnrJ/EryC1/StrS family aminotransferase n=1 Tax=Adhaeribacter terreus TaxID=529703 RepID=A0ABW0E8J3_9BACT
MTIPFLSFEAQNKQIKPLIMQAIEEVFDSQWYVLGKAVKNFEAAYADFSQTQFCIGVANGLDALHIALKTLNIGPGDEVIVPSNTYIASWMAVSFVGATPVPVEPDPETYNLDPCKIEAAITSKTKAIMPVHLYGQACEMDAIMAIAKKYDLFVVEDNAQSQGATFNDKVTGSFGDINGTSFYPGKNLGALGDAGAITTNKSDLAQKAQSIRNYGSQKKYYNEVIGINSRLDELQAAVLNVKLPFLTEWTQQRQAAATIYYRELEGIEDLILPKIIIGATHVYHLFVIRTSKRDTLQAHLNRNGIGTLIHYPVPPHLQKAYQASGFNPGDFPIAESLANTSLSLPMYPGLTENEIVVVCNQIKSFFYAQA